MPRGGGARRRHADPRLGIFARTEPPAGFDPGAIGVPGWEAPTAPGFVVLRLAPWRLQVRTVGAAGVELRTWRD